MGMGLDDFCRCTPGEFRAVYDSWFSHQEMRVRHDWEVGRFVATTAVQPYSKKPLRPTDLIHFPWEKTYGTDATVPKGTSSKEKMMELWAKWKGMGINDPQESSCERPPCETSDQAPSH